MPVDLLTPIAVDGKTLLIRSSDGTFTPFNKGTLVGSYAINYGLANEKLIPIASKLESAIETVSILNETNIFSTADIRKGMEDLLAGVSLPTVVAALAKTTPGEKSEAPNPKKEERPVFDEEFQILAAIKALTRAKLREIVQGKGAPAAVDGMKVLFDRVRTQVMESGVAEPHVLKEFADKKILELKLDLAKDAPAFDAKQQIIELIPRFARKLKEWLEKEGKSSESNDGDSHLTPPPAVGSGWVLSHNLIEWQSLQLTQLDLKSDHMRIDGKFVYEGTGGPLAPHVAEFGEINKMMPGSADFSKVNIKPGYSVFTSIYLLSEQDAVDKKTAEVVAGITTEILRATIEEGARIALTAASAEAGPFAPLAVLLAQAISTALSKALEEPMSSMKQLLQRRFGA